MEDRKKLNKIKRNNAKLYPIYKMFSWDLLFFYSVEFLFYTITKKVTASEILIINGFYLLFRILMQIPAVTITDSIGKRKSIILGNIMLIFYMLILIFAPGAISIIIADLIFALGYDMKTIAESNLLYDSVSTRGGEGLYSKIDAKGGSWYYILDGIASLTAGYLFVMNNYIPMLICLGFIIISTVLSFRFKDVYEVKKSNNKNAKFSNTLREYKNDLKSSFKFILKSKRMKAYVLFQIAFYSLIEIIDTYNSDLLTNIGIPEEQFSMIFAILTFIGGISLSLKKPIEKKFGNRTLSFISLMYIGACIIIGIISSLYVGTSIIPIILVMFAMQKCCTSIWYILEYKYLKNFTKEESRNKITFAYEFIGGIAIGILPTEKEINYVGDNWKDNLSAEERENLIAQIKLCDGIIMQGGIETDNYEIIIAKYCYDNNIPVLGICAGQNNIVRALGGATYKIPNPEKHNRSSEQYVHTIKIDKNSKFFSFIGKEEILVNSRHKRTVKDCPKLNKVAFCEDGYADVIEAEDKDVYIGVRFHPESLYRIDKNMNNIFSCFIEKCKRKKEERIR